MFHHLRRLWRPEGRSKPLPSRHCCGNDSSGPPSFGGVPRGPVLRLRRKTTRIPYASACACDAAASQPHTKPCPALWRSAGIPGGLAPERQTGGALPPTRKKKALRFAPALLFFFLRLPPAGCHLHRWLRPHRSFFHTLRSTWKKIDGTPSRARPAPWAARRACPPPQRQPPRTSLRYGIAGGQHLGRLPRTGSRLCLRGLFLASALCLIS